MPMERLAFKNRFVATIVQELIDFEASTSTPQTISGEDNLILLRVSFEQWKKILSSVFTGADICYPEESDSVRWPLLKAVEQPMDLCALIADCIATSEATQAALRNFITSDPAINQYIQNISNLGTIIPNPGEIIVQNDDLDALFGACTYLIDTMNGANEDLYQALEASTNSRETGEIMFRSIPIVEALPFDEVSAYIDNIAGAVAENYASQYTLTPETGMRDRLRCALFCLARANDNSLTWELIANYFWGEVGFTVGDYVEVFRDFVTFFTEGTWPGEEVVFISFANIASVLSTSQTFAAMTFPSLANLIALGANDPDPDWEILCIDCPPDDWVVNDFTTGSSFTWEAIGPYAAFDNGWTDGTADNVQIE